MEAPYPKTLQAKPWSVTAVAGGGVEGTLRIWGDVTARRKAVWAMRRKGATLEEIRAAVGFFGIHGVLLVSLSVCFSNQSMMALKSLGRSRPLPPLAAPCPATRPRPRRSHKGHCGQPPRRANSRP